MSSGFSQVCMILVKQRFGKPKNYCSTLQKKEAGQINELMPQ